MKLKKEKRQIVFIVNPDQLMGVGLSDKTTFLERYEIDKVTLLTVAIRSLNLKCDDRAEALGFRYEVSSFILDSLVNMEVKTLLSRESDIVIEESLLKLADIVFDYYLALEGLFNDFGLDNFLSVVSKRFFGEDVVVMVRLD